MLNDFFRKGFLTTCLEKKQCDEILEIINSINFIESKDKRDVGYKPPLIADWDDCVDGPIVAAHNCQENLKTYWFEFKKHIKPVEEILGDFDSGSVIINKFPAGHGMDWHTDTVDTSIAQILLYLSKDSFEKDDGGYLQIGDSLILPNHATMVVMNNLTPTLFHRVEPLRSGKQRLTAVFRYGYMTNTLTKHRLLTMKGQIK